MSEIFAPGMLDGRVALVTGGGTGLGRAAAAELRACGAEVVICGRREDVLRERPRSSARTPSPATSASRDDAERIVRFALERCGRLDVLVNNAGGQYFVPAEAIEPKGWRAVHAAQRRRDGADGAVAAETSRSGPAGEGPCQRHALAASRAGGHDALERGAGRGRGAHARARARVARRRDRGASPLAAGHFDTESLRKYPEPVWKAAARTVPLQRLGREEEHAWLVALAASPLGHALSGSVITLDGARDNWFGPWPPESLTADGGEVPTEARRPR